MKLKRVRGKLDLSDIKTYFKTSVIKSKCLSIKKEAEKPMEENEEFRIRPEIDEA